MHIHVLDQYRHADSPVHRLDPRVKLVSALFFILACALTPDGAWPAFVALALLWLAVTLMADVSLTLLLRRGLIALPFMLAAVTVLFTIAGAPLLTIPLPFSNHTLVITDNGVIRFFTIMLKSWLSVLMALLLSATTTFPDILRALRGIGVPNVLVGVIGFMYRYMFVLGDEVLRLMRAREARMAWGPPGQKHGGTVIWRARIVGGMVGSLFVRSLDRSDRVYNAMVSRGYTGEIVWPDKPALHFPDIAWAGGFAVVLITIELWARLL
ncbi:MAG: cobalt ECF transporter T component CbiQ [Anaerolineae bacterium]|nr:cobalt ECF transporter T component CbiQ [Anaerolineae bacterium]MCB0228281.1 cobalt ECF transporter T component CbiQ [Anaerolineae bacterium]MCB0235483.1 cobalt ECF transporter T component CbiQ [Anaerolineae bacterium]MCB0244701.1 cobalt ECF transporter T component CbiQ [Anaerolineae bacterium]